MRLIQSPMDFYDTSIEIDIVNEDSIDSKPLDLHVFLFNRLD